LAFSRAQVRFSCLKLSFFAAPTIRFSFSRVAALATSLTWGPDSSPARTALSNSGSSVSLAEAFSVPAAWP
jgi:hypothetical protein